MGYIMYNNGEVEEIDMSETKLERVKRRRVELEKLLENVIDVMRESNDEFKGLETDCEDIKDELEGSKGDDLEDIEVSIEDTLYNIEVVARDLVYQLNKIIDLSDKI